MAVVSPKLIALSVDGINISSPVVSVVIITLIDDTLFAAELR